MLVLFLALLISSARSTTLSGGDTTFVYGACTQQKYSTSSTYPISLNTLLTNMVSSASYNIYDNFTVSAASTATAYGLFQCRGDMVSVTCSNCISNAISQLGVLCPDSYGGALQLEGCLIKYDSAAFIGAEDKTVLVKRCGPGQSDHRFGPNEQMFEYLSGQQLGYYRVGVAGKGKGEAQCAGDLSPAECQGCLSEAVGRLRSECSGAKWGDVFLVKCYARFAGSGGYARTHSTGGGGVDSNDTNSNDSKIQKHLMVIIGIIIGVALLVICLSFINKYFDKERHECK